MTRPALSWVSVSAWRTSVYFWRQFLFDVYHLALLGGDQYNYVSFFKDNALEDLLNQHISVKQAPIGGTSAGMAILGGKYFSGANGTITSATAMSNPYHPNVTLEGYDGTPTPTFLNVPFLRNVITDTHYDNRDRKGRHVTFMARIKLFTSIYGIASNEYVASRHFYVFIDYFLGIFHEHIYQKKAHTILIFYR